GSARRCSAPAAAHARPAAGRLRPPSSGLQQHRRDPRIGSRAMVATVPVHTLILSHANVDFDAFAGMLAAQLLYPDARICLHGGVNRNGREFYNLHADQIPSVEPATVDRDSVRRLVLIEVTAP